jgi:hypothetical protein
MCLEARQKRKGRKEGRWEGRKKRRGKERKKEGGREDKTSLLVFWDSPPTVCEATEEGRSENDIINRQSHWLMWLVCNKCHWLCSICLLSKRGDVDRMLM